LFASKDTRVKLALFQVPVNHKALNNSFASAHRINQNNINPKWNAFDKYFDASKLLSGAKGEGSLKL